MLRSSYTCPYCGQVGEMTLENGLESGNRIEYCSACDRMLVISYQLRLELTPHALVEDSQ